jgi:hypothetical protein
VIDGADRPTMQSVPLCGPEVVARRVERLNLAAGSPIWRPPFATRARANMIAAAEQQAHRA